MNRGVIATHGFDMLPGERVASAIQRGLERGIYERLV